MNRLRLAVSPRYQRSVATLLVCMMCKTCVKVGNMMGPMMYREKERIFEEQETTVLYERAVSLRMQCDPRWILRWEWYCFVCQSEFCVENDIVLFVRVAYLLLLVLNCPIRTFVTHLLAYFLIHVNSQNFVNGPRHPQHGRHYLIQLFDISHQNG